jgi:multiple sugar transport system substrate-binding protein
MKLFVRVRPLALWVVILSLSVLVFGIPTSPSKAAGPVAITYWHGLTGPDGKFLTAMADQFNKEQTAIRVTASVYPWDVFFDKWVAAAAAGNPPDVVTYHINEMPQYQEKGILVPLDDLVKQAGIDMGAFPKVAREAAYRHNQLWGVPLDIHPVALYYNVALVRAAGLDPNKPPTNRDQFLTWARKLTKADGSQYGVAMPGTNVDTFRVWWGWIFQNGGKFISADGKTAEMDDPKTAEALQFAADLVYKYKVAPPGESDPDADFKSQKVGMEFQGPWWITGYQDAGLNFRTAAQPAIFAQPGVWASDHFFSLSQTKDAQRQLATIKFVKWLEDHALLWSQAGQVPANDKVRASQEYKSSKLFPFLNGFQAEIPYAHLTPSIVQSTEIFAENVQTPLVVNYQAVMLNKKSASQALKDMQQGIQSVLNRP